MKRIIALVAGIGLAAGLAMATIAQTPLEIVDRYFAASDAAGIEANWTDWHPEATHSITIRYGTGQPDDSFGYAISDWETLPDWQDDPNWAEAMAGYVETARSTPQISSEEVDGGTSVTATTRIDYDWHGYSGQAVQTDRFQVVPYKGRQVIRSVETVIEYP